GRSRDRCEHPWWGAFQQRGALHRVSLSKWADREVTSKQQAQAIYEDFRQAVRQGRVSPNRGHERPLTFDRFADLYVERYVKAKGLTSADTIEYRLRPIRAHFGPKLLSDIKTADVEDFVATLRRSTIFVRNQKRPRTRRPATINRYLSLLGHMFNWAV